MELLPSGQTRPSLKWYLSVAVAVSLIVGFIVGWLSAGARLGAGGPGGSLVDKIKNNLSATTTTTTAGALANFTVLDQPPGNQVLIRDVAITGQVWLAVYEDREGEPGNVLGAVFVRPGTYPALAIPLLRNTVDDLPYYVQAHTDDGDGMFDYRQDQLIKDLSLAAGTFTTKSTGSRGDN